MNTRFHEEHQPHFPYVELNLFPSRASPEPVSKESVAELHSSYKTPTPPPPPFQPFLPHNHGYHAFTLQRVLSKARARVRHRDDLQRRLLCVP